MVKFSDSSLGPLLSIGCIRFQVVAAVGAALLGFESQAVFAQIDSAVDNPPGASAAPRGDNYPEIKQAQRLLEKGKYR